MFQFIGATFLIFFNGQICKQYKFPEEKPLNLVVGFGSSTFRGSITKIKLYSTLASAR